MINSQFILPIAHELIVDLFAGGGGASTGIEQAIGRHVDIAVNHDPEAIALHQANHPQTRHFVSDVFDVDPWVICAGQPVGLLWASPDCCHFSKAKGGKPVSSKRRSLAWVVVKWAHAVAPRVICLENVEEFQSWGPLTRDGRPCPKRKGQTFARWTAALRGLGYAVEWRELRACDYGAPTIRKRLFLVARRDGDPIAWPVPTHGAPGTLPVRQKRLKPWRAAAECIDWSLPCPSIFERPRLLADATLRRIAKGVMRYVVEAAEPFVVGVGGRAGRSPERPLSRPLGTVTSKADAALVVPTLIPSGYGERPDQLPRTADIDRPLGTIVGVRKHALVSALLAKHYTGVVGSDLPASIGTVTSQDHHSLVVSSLVKLRGTSTAQSLREPLHTVSAQGQHFAEVRVFLIAYYGSEAEGSALPDPLRTQPTRDRFGRVTVRGEEYAIVDIGLRMLQPRELYRAQGFPADYRIDRGGDGRVLTKTAQVRMVGNSVAPPCAAAIVAANYRSSETIRKAA